MQSDQLNARIVARGKEFFASIAGEKPSLFDKGAWMGKVTETKYYYPLLVVRFHRHLH